MNRPRSHVPMWIRTMPRGVLRSYLIAVFLPPRRGQYLSGQI